MKAPKTAEEIIQERNVIASSKESRVQIRILNAMVQAKVDERNKEIDEWNFSHPNETEPHITWWPMEIDVNLMFTPDWQRIIDIPRVSKIEADFKDELVQIKSVCYVNGLLVLCDGLQTRSFTPRKKMWVRFFPNSSMETALFIMSNQYTNVRRIPAAKIFECNRLLGYKREVEIGNFLDSKGLTVIACRKNKKNNVNCIGKVLKIHKDCQMAGVRMAFNAIFDAGWEQYEDGFNVLNLEIGLYLYNGGSLRNDKNYKRVINAMKKMTPAEFIEKAGATCPGPTGQHGEKTIQRYTCYLAVKG